MADLLRVSCHDCGTSFVSAHQQRRQALARDRQLGLSERCPHCGTVSTYRRGDYHHGGLVGPCPPLSPSTPR